MPTQQKINHIISRAILIVIMGLSASALIAASPKIDKIVEAEYTDKGDISGLSSDNFNVMFGPEGITHLTLSNDPDTDFIWSEKSKNWGNMIIRYRTSDSDWHEYVTENNSNRRSTASGNDWYEIHYNIGDQANPELMMKERFSLSGNTLTWTIELLNNSNTQQIIGDLAFNNFFHIIERDSWQTRLYLHPFIAGHGSYLYWERPNGQGPFLVMTPLSGTKLEYFDRPNIAGWAWDGNYNFYIHPILL